MNYLPKYLSGNTRDPIFTLDAGFPEADYVADTAFHQGPYIELRALTACVIASLAITQPSPGNAGTPTGGRINGTLTNINVPAGVTFPGAIASFTLTSGTLLAIKGS